MFSSLISLSFTLTTLTLTSALSINPLHNHLHSQSTQQTTLTSDSQFSLQNVGGEDFMAFQHVMFPDHTVRIKSTTGWCDPDVKSFSGYINTAKPNQPSRDLFFWFFESRSSPSTDPVLMWINGGPGCSSSLGMLMELGPCTIVDPTRLNGTKRNDYSWNDKANLFILDQPIEVGFSHGEMGVSTSDTLEAAIDVQAFITIFFETFNEFKGRPFFMSGESYGGRYLPVFASAVIDGNDILTAHGKEPINLQGVLIGNGMTDHYKMLEAWGQHQCVTVPGMEKPYQNIGTCVEIAKGMPYCSKMLQRDCVTTHDPNACHAAQLFCGELVQSTFFSLHRNPYDVSKPCTLEELSDGLCYGSITHPINQYLDLPEVRELFGVDKVVGNFTSCSGKVGNAFNAREDSGDKTWLYVAALLERGINVISYVGTLDWICNYLGNQAWLETLEWTGGAQFAAENLHEWTVDGKVAGATKSFGALTFASVYSAGHMVPYDKPVEALAMLNRFMAGGGSAL